MKELPKIIDVANQPSIGGMDTSSYVISVIGKRLVSYSGAWNVERYK